MPASRAGFSVIDHYCDLSKQVLESEESVCSPLIPLDQEVPQMRSFVDCSDIDYLDVKAEPQDAGMPDVFMEHMLSTPASNNNNSNSLVPESRLPTILPSHPFSPTKDSRPSSHRPLSPSPQYSPKPSRSSSSLSSSSLSVSSTSSPSSSPLLSSTAFTSMPSPAPSSSSRTPPPAPYTAAPSPHSSANMASYVTELGGSGGVVMTTAQQSSSMDSVVSSTEAYSYPSNFLMLPDTTVPEENLDYLDLDQQPVTLYDDLRLDGIKTEPTVDNIMDAVMMMRDVVHQDSDKLQLPYDPVLWSTEQVRTWMTWVCRKNGLPEVTSHGLTGPVLCSWREQDFVRHFGQGAEGVRNELELWKAANSCFPDNELPYTYPSTLMSQPSPMDTQPSSQLPYTVTRLSEQQSRLTPCVSPAPSSEDSGLGGSLSHGTSDSEEDCGSGDGHGHYTSGATKVGRGHKQTIYLWQFLRELLVTDEADYSDCIRWLDRKAGIFKIEDSKKVAHLWGRRKNRPAMNYDKLSRSMRQYYKKKIMKKTDQAKRLVYQFCPGHI